MYDLFSAKQPPVTGKAPKQAKVKPAFKDQISKANQGIILFNDTDLQSILKNSGEHAISNEYQVHFWSLVFRHRAADGSILDISIPTVFYNYKQEVGVASVDFELTDVEEISTAVLPIHEMKVKEILATSFLADIESLFDIKFELMSHNLSNSHRHPSF